jgi:hypothetical protein
MKLTPIRTFLLRQEDVGDKKKDVIAYRGVKIEVNNEEHRRLSDYFVEPYAKKKSLTVR